VQAAKGIEATERKILALGMVDPTMTEAEAGQWQKASPGGEIEAVSLRRSPSCPGCSTAPRRTW
jgi:hypothetical protein